MCKWQILKSEKSSPVNDISEAVRWDGVGSGICLFHIQAESSPSTSYFEKWQKIDQKHLQHSTQHFYLKYFKVNDRPD